MDKVITILLFSRNLTQNLLVWMDS